MTKTTTLICALTAGAFLAGCNSGGGTYQPKAVEKAAPLPAVTAGQEASIMPLTLGNEWVYESSIVVQQGGQQASNETDVTFRIVRSTTNANGTTGILEIKTQEGQPERQTWLTNSKGVYQVSAGANNALPFTPAQPAVTFPLEKGRKVNWTGTGLLPGGGRGASRLTQTILDNQEVDTAMGRMIAIPVETRQSWGSGQTAGQSASTVWWVPGTGIVRFRQEIVTPQASAVQVLRLKSKSLKGS